MDLKKKSYILFILFAGVTLFVAGFYFGKDQKVFIDPFEDIDLSLFSETYYLLKTNHPEFHELSEEEIVYGMINGVIDALGDPHTAFLNPDRSKIFLDDVSGEFEGVGIEIGIRDRGIEVISPLKETPAYKAGIMAGDLIISVDSQSTENFTLEEAVYKIRGPKGEEVVLGIEREGDKKELPIVRDTIKLPSIEWEIIEGNIAYIDLFHFHSNIKEEFKNFAEEITESNAEGIILDLRGNPGGLLEVAINVSSYFVEPNEVVVIESASKEKDDDSDIRKIRTQRVSPLLVNYPLVILIDERSASGSEILAGALRDNRDTPIVGQNSFMKGSIQRLHNLPGGSVVKITERYFLTPKGYVINDIGIKPDYEIEITEEDIEEGLDPQLRKAIEVIKD